MDLRQLQYFVKIFETKNFTKAAELLHIAQPALGYQIRKLETELKTELLRRHPRGVEPTEAGRLLAAHAYDVLGRVEGARSAVRDFGASVAGHVTIGVHPEAHSVALELLKRQPAEFPAVSLSLMEAYAEILIEWVKTGQVDLAYGYWRGGKVSGVRLERLRQDDLFFVCSAGLMKPSQKPIRLADAAKHPLILHGQRRPVIEAAARKAGVALRVPFDVKSDYLVKELVARKLGGAVTFYDAVRAEVESGQFIARRIVEPTFSNHLTLIQREHHPLSKAAEAARTLIKKSVGRGK